MFQGRLQRLAGGIEFRLGVPLAREQPNGVAVRRGSAVKQRQCREQPFCQSVGAATNAEVRAVHAQGHAHRAGKGMQRALRHDMRRDGDGASHAKLCERPRCRYSAGLTRRAHHTAAVERQRLRQTCYRIQDCPDGNHRLLVAVAEKPWR